MSSLVRQVLEQITTKAAALVAYNSDLLLLLLLVVVVVVAVVAAAAVVLLMRWAVRAVVGLWFIRVVYIGFRVQGLGSSRLAYI